MLKKLSWVKEYKVSKVWCYGLIADPKLADFCAVWLTSYKSINKYLKR